MLHHSQPPRRKGITHLKSGVVRLRHLPWQSFWAFIAILAMLFTLWPGNVLPAQAAGGNGVMILDRRTLPRGAVWLNDAQGGHWWFSDSIDGFCRIDPNPALVPPWQTSNCNTTAKSPGQPVVGTTPQGATVIFVPDAASKSVKVVRFLFNPGNAASGGTISAQLTMNVTNPTAVGGGTAGGRPVGAALAPNGQDLYVGYLKSGDIMRVTGAVTTTNGNPPQAKIGSTSDGRGINALVMFGNDLYISESGGQGFSKITDPSGVARPACNAASPCTAQSVGGVSSFPGGLATDGTYIYVGEATLSVPGKILRYKPSDGSVDTYSQNVPAYSSGGITITQYIGPLGLGVKPNGDLYVGDDPQFAAGTPVNNQGHIWLVPVTAGSPEVKSITPTSGPAAGGTVVTINGSNFDAAANGTTVSFGPNAAANVVCANANTCTATSPSGSGTVDVRVTTSGGTSAAVAADQFSYVAGPTVASIAPTSGPQTGGTVVTITGTGFSTSTTTVKFGGVDGTGVSCASTTTCTATSPAGTGTVDVQVTVGGQQSPVNQPGDQFTYVAPPAVAVTSIAPTSGPAAGGTTVTITGTGFDPTAGVTTVAFGANAATNVSCASATTCTATSPAGTGKVDVVVTVATGAGPVSSLPVAGDQFTYTPAPTVTSIAPTSGPAAGGTTVTITGTGFDATATVKFGGVDATGVSCANATTCTATSPAGTGTVDVTVTAGGQTSATSAADQFTYKAPVAPTVTSIAPNTGTDVGGTSVTINGTNLVDAINFPPNPTLINFGPNSATGVSCTNDGFSCTAISPANPAGVVDVTVSVSGQTSATSAADQFTYTASAGIPVVTNISPSNGFPGGGTIVTITGGNFNPAPGATTVNFGANPATGVVCSVVTCTATSPAGTGVVNLIVTTAGGASAPVQFTYSTPTANFYAWGITAPKGGATWLPGALGGHWWSSDHAQGFCRQDPVPNTNLHAINYGVCGDDLVGSAGQGVYDPRANGNGTHYVYVPDNAVKSTAVWRLTFDPATETMVPDPQTGDMATAMIPLADVRTLKPNGMALGPDGNLYVSDLTEKYIRQVTNPNGDPRTQTVGIVAETGDGRGANGTMGFIGNLLYIPGNRATQFFDIRQCPNVGNTTPPAVPACGMASVPAPTGVFVAGAAVDAPHRLVYMSDSPGGAGAHIFRYNASSDVYVAFPAGSVAPDANGVVTCPGCTVGSTAQPFVSNGTLPAANSPNATVFCALTCQRPFDFGNHPGGPGSTIGFSFVFGLGVSPNGELIITEDPSAGARSARGTMWSVPFIP